MDREQPGGRTVLQAGDLVDIHEREGRLGILRKRPAVVKYAKGEGGLRGPLVVCPLNAKGAVHAPSGASSIEDGDLGESRQGVASKENR